MDPDNLEPEFQEFFSSQDPSPFFRKVGQRREKEFFFFPVWASKLARLSVQEKVCPECKGKNPFCFAIDRTICLVKPVGGPYGTRSVCIVFCSKACRLEWICREDQDGKLSSIGWFVPLARSQQVEVKEAGRFTGVLCENHLCGNQEFSGWKRFKKCGLCKSVSYCCKRCQTEDWKNGHKAECRINRGKPLSQKDFKALSSRYPDAPQGWWMQRPTVPPTDLDVCICYTDEQVWLIRSMEHFTCSRVGCSRPRFYPRCSEIRMVLCERENRKRHHYFEVGYCSSSCQRKADKVATSIAVKGGFVGKLFGKDASVVLDKRE